MDTIILPLLSLLFTAIGWIYTAFQQKRLLERQITADIEREFRNDLQDKVLIVKNHIEQFAKLNRLFGLKSGFSFQVKRDKDGNLVRENDDFIVEEKYFQSDQALEEAVQQMNGVSVQSLIDQTRFTISLDSGNVSDILAEIDDSNELVERLRELYMISIHSYEFIYKHPQYWNKSQTPAKIFDILERSTQKRREFRMLFEKAVQKKKEKAFLSDSTDKRKKTQKYRDLHE